MYADAINETELLVFVLFCFLPELVSALSGLLDVVIALEPVTVACVAVAAAAKAARFCMALRPDRHKHTLTLSLQTSLSPE